MSDEANLEALAFDPSDRPAAGTACVACRAAGHFCPAKGHCGEDALCLACGAGGQCDQAGAVERVLAGVGWDDMQVDPRGLHGECRTIAIEDADRVAKAETPVASGWTIKASLRAENLVRMKRVRPATEKPVRVRRKSQKKLEAERDAGRRRRMSEVNVTETVRLGEASEIVLAAPAQRLSKVEAMAKAFELRPSLSAAKISVVVGRSQPVVSGWFRDADATAKKPKAAKKLAVISSPVVVEQPVEMVSVRLPSSAMDKLFSLLPTASKVSAVEKLMAELGGA